MHSKHPKKEVNDALDYADHQGFDVERTSCLAIGGAELHARAEPSVSIWSTPQESS